MFISVVLIVKNAQDTVLKVLNSVQFAKEIIVVDIESTDETVKLAKRYTDKIYPYGKESLFVEPVRNFALAKATEDWVLVLDGDEEVSPALAKKLLAITADEQAVDAYYLPRKNLVSGYFMQHTGWWPDYQLRFFRKGVVSWSEQIHAQPLLAKNATTTKLPADEMNALIHHNYANTHDYIARLNRYTDIEALQKKAQSAPDFSISHSSLLHDFADDLFRRLFALQGYRDGVRGFYLSIMQAAYQMTVKMKLFDLLGNQSKTDVSDTKRFLQDLRHFQKELNYWIHDLEVQESRGVHKWWIKLKRKLQS